MNKCILIGNVTKDPEHSTTNSGISVCKFSIAVNRTFTSANGERETDFFNIVTWRGLADNCSKYIAKGSKVAVCGQLQTRSYEDRDGIKRQVTEINASDVEFLSSKTETSGSNSGYKKVSDLVEADENDDLPF